MSFASVPKRIAAFAIDLAFLACMLMLLHVVLDRLLSVHYEDVEGFPLLAYSLLTVSLPMWLYFTFAESSRFGATLGKRLLRLRVTDDDGGRLGRGRALLRTIVKLFPVDTALATLCIPTPIFAPEGRVEYRFGTVLVFAMLMVYLFMTTWTETKQSMHDLIAESFVVQLPKPKRLA